jgi:hypothetical protein
MSILEASETEEDTLLSVGRLKYKYKKFVSENFRQHPFRNADTGWDIRISNSGMREMEKLVLKTVLRFTPRAPPEANDPLLHGIISLYFCSRFLSSVFWVVFNKTRLEKFMFDGLLLLPLLPLLRLRGYSNGWRYLEAAPRSAEFNLNDSGAFEPGTESKI